MLIIIMLSFGNLYPQNITDSLLVDFFNKTFNDFFTEKKTRNPLKNDFYISKGSTIPEGVNTDFANFKLHLLDKHQEYPLIQKGKISELYFANTKEIGTDTIDIVIHTYSVSYKKRFRIVKNEGKRKLITGDFRFGLHCRGDMGYIPDGRFIYSIEANEWKYITSNEVREEVMEKLFKKSD